jgi:hypothetical protein
LAPAAPPAAQLACRARLRSVAARGASGRRQQFALAAVCTCADAAFANARFAALQIAALLPSKSIDAVRRRFTLLEARCGRFWRPALLRWRMRRRKRVSAYPEP